MTAHRHLTSEQIVLLMRGRDLPEEAAWLTVHLLVGGCAVCREMIRLGVGGLDDLGGRTEGLPAKP